MEEWELRRTCKRLSKDIINYKKEKYDTEVSRGKVFKEPTEQLHAKENQNNHHKDPVLILWREGLQSKQK